MTTRRTTVLLMAYGSPETPGQVADYLTHIRGGRTPTDGAVTELTRRYERVGGRTPLLQITTAVARALEHALAESSGDEGSFRVHVGMKHWHPFIGDVVPQLVDDGADRLIAIPLAPHYSRISIGGYRRALEDALRVLGWPLDATLVESWHLQAELISVLSTLVAEALSRFDGARAGDITTVFSAHSLPVRIRDWGDPYESQLAETSEAVARAARVRDRRFAWQSAGHTGEPWLGPDVCEYLENLAEEGVRRVLVAPVGFVSDHLEILYDLDVEARDRAERLGIELKRTEMPNARPDFVAALVRLVRAAEGDGAPGVATVRLSSRPSR